MNVTNVATTPVQIHTAVNRKARLIDDICLLTSYKLNLNTLNYPN